MINLSSWTDEDLRAGLDVIAGLRKAATPDLSKNWAAWDAEREAMEMDGNHEGRRIIDHILTGMHDGMTQRSRATHNHIYRELQRAGLREHANRYWSVYREHARSRRFIHPHDTFGRANSELQHERATVTPTAHAETPMPAVHTPTVAIPAPATPSTFRYFLGDMMRTWTTGTSTSRVDTRQLIEGVIRPGGGPNSFVRGYRNARNAGMSHEEIITAAADESNRLDPNRADPFTPERVQQALADQYRLSGRSFNPGAGSYEVGGVSYAWGERPHNVTDQSAPTIGRVRAGTATIRHEPSRPAGESAPSGTHTTSPPIAGDDRYIQGTGPGGTITSADRILYHHQTGGINDEVQKLYERDLLKFQTAGGTLISLKNGDARFAGLLERYNQNVYPNLPHDSRHQHGASFMKSNLEQGAASYHNRGGSVIALDKNGNPVAAVGYAEMADELHVGVAGSAGLLAGAGMAMQWGMANVCVKHNKKLGSSYLPDARAAHASWGRHITASGSSRWALADAKKISEFRPAAPAIQE